MAYHKARRAEVALERGHITSENQNVLGAAQMGLRLACVRMVTTLLCHRYNKEHALPSKLIHCGVNTFDETSNDQMADSIPSSSLVARVNVLSPGAGVASGSVCAVLPR